MNLYVEISNQFPFQRIEGWALRGVGAYSRGHLLDIPGSRVGAFTRGRLIEALLNSIVSFFNEISTAYISLLHLTAS